LTFPTSRDVLSWSSSELVDDEDAESNSLFFWSKTFNDRAPIVWWCFFGYNSPATLARELFTPSTDAARLLGSIKKF